MDNGDAPVVVTLHVATDGCDGWSGAFARPTAGGTDGPLATVAAARDRLRAIRVAGRLMAAADVHVHAGRYELREALRFAAADLGDERTPVTYRTAGDGAVHLSGSVRLDGFTPYRGPIVKLDLRVSGLPWHAIRNLFCNGVRQRPARYPSFDPANPYGGGWLYVEGEPPKSIYEGGHGRRDRFVCHDPRLRRWSSMSEVELVIFPRYNWANDIVRIWEYDPTTGEVTLASPTTWEIYPGDRFYVQNVAEELDAPGEWYLDRALGILYFYPPEALEGAVVEAAVADTLIVVTGAPPAPDAAFPEKETWLDADAPVSPLRDPASFTRGYLTFRGFVLEGCDGDGVIVRDARACVVEGCVVRNTGGFGVRLWGGAACRVSDCDVYDTGSGGIELSGGRRWAFEGVYRPCEHEARNNYVHHVGTVRRHVAAIGLNGVGITVAHNLIHDAPRWGVISRGNDNVIAYNHIRHVDIETADTAAIYLVDRDFSMRGTRIEYNHIHDILGYDRIEGVWHSPAFAFGIYLDDWTSGVTICGNLVYRTPRGGVYIHAGQDNVVENNMFLGATEEMAVFRRWEEALELQRCGTHDQGLRRNMFRHNILATGQSGARAYHLDNAGDTAGALDLTTNSWQGNLIWIDGGAGPVTYHIGGHHAEMSWEQWRALGYDAGSVVADPQFANSADDDFRLGEDSPALALGFTPLPIESMGPYRSDVRPAWPIVEAEGARERPLTK